MLAQSNPTNLPMDYESLSKEQLIEHIHSLNQSCKEWQQINASSLALVDETQATLKQTLALLNSTSVEDKWEAFKTEAALLGEDLLKVVKFVYELGVRSGKQINHLIDQAKPEPAKAVVAEVVLETEFPY